MLGLDLAAVHPDRYCTDSATLLMVDAFVTVSHLMLDIRWQEMVFMGVVAVLPFAGLLFFVGRPEGAAAPALLFCLAAMVGCASFGRWNHEFQPRVNFPQVLKVKTLRCQAEFRVEQVPRVPILVSGCLHSGHR